MSSYARSGFVHVSVWTWVFTSGSNIGIKLGFDLSLGYGLGWNKVLYWIQDKEFKWDTTLAFDLGFGL
eukprot:6514782-Ditylum_brightwellii.AAC.1